MPARGRLHGLLERRRLARHPSWPAAFQALLSASRRSRGFGDFWGHMLVARGAADFMIEPELRIWDWASVLIIVEEAGGRVTTFGGDPLRRLEHPDGHPGRPPSTCCGRLERP